jgi:hypothetical protein
VKIILQYRIKYHHILGTGSDGNLFFFISGMINSIENSVFVIKKRAYAGLPD